MPPSSLAVAQPPRARARREEVVPHLTYARVWGLGCRTLGRGARQLDGAAHGERPFPRGRLWRPGVSMRARADHFERASVGYGERW